MCWFVLFDADVFLVGSEIEVGLVSIIPVFTLLFTQ